MNTFKVFGDQLTFFNSVFMLLMIIFSFWFWFSAVLMPQTWKTLRAAIVLAYLQIDAQLLLSPRPRITTFLHIASNQLDTCF